LPKKKEAYPHIHDASLYLIAIITKKGVPRKKLDFVYTT
jgi:hypothetical protein